MGKDYTGIYHVLMNNSECLQITFQTMANQDGFGVDKLEELFSDLKNMKIDFNFEIANTILRTKISE